MMNWTHLIPRRNEHLCLVITREWILVYSNVCCTSGYPYKRYCCFCSDNEKANDAWERSLEYDNSKISGNHCYIIHSIYCLTIIIIIIIVLTLVSPFINLIFCRHFHGSAKEYFDLSSMRSYFCYFWPILGSLSPHTKVTIVITIFYLPLSPVRKINPPIVQHHYC